MYRSSVIIILGFLLQRNYPNGYCVCAKRKEAEGSYMNELIIYKRPRIDSMLSGILSMPLTVVTATAGYGKTTAVHDFLHQKHIDKIWISITDASEEFLWEKLCEGIAAFSTNAAAELSALSVPQDQLQIARIMDFIRKRLHRPLVLVLDDYHLIPLDSRLNTLINALAFENIPDFHLVLIARGTPNIKLYTLASRQLCNRLDTGDLAFTKDETAGYLAARGLRLAPDAIEEIMRKTDGWVSAIYLIGEGIRHGQAIGNIRSISGLIQENLLDRLKQRQQKWLVRLSVFDAFSGSLAVAALNTTEIQDLLDTLIAENAFLTNDAGIYRFHPLLRDVLQQRVTEDDPQREFYYRAGQWYRKNSFNSEAFEFYYRSGHIEEYFEQLNMPEIRSISYSAIDRLYRAVTELPESTCLKYPFPYLQIIFFLMISGNAAYFETGRKLLERLSDSFSDSEAPNSGIIRGECLVIRRLGGLDPPERWNVLLKKAAQEFAGHHSAVISPRDPFTFNLPMLLHSEFLSPGTLDDAVRRCSINYFEQITDGFGAGSESLIFAEAALVRCNIPDARDYAWKAISQAQESSQYYVAASGRFTLLRACLLEGNAGGAQEQMDAIRSLSVLAADNQYKAAVCENFSYFIECCEGFLTISLGLTQRIPAVFLTHSPSPLPPRMMGGMGVPLCLRTRAQLLSGNCAEAIGLCNEFRRDAGTAKSQLARLSMEIQRTVAEAILYPDRPDAESTLARALDQAKQDQVLLLFAEYARPLLPLLQKVLRRQTADVSFCRRVIAVCQDVLANPADKIFSPGEVGLTDREVEIIRYAARSMTRKEIAAKLYIQENTVKKHLSSIYRKLNVDNKVSAIDAARQMKLI